MIISEITSFLETIAPPSLQESYDNAGLICGNSNWECTGALICLDSIESVVDEAIANKCNLIIAHHPIVFSGLKKINGKNYIERTLIKAIKNDIAIYAIHTNLDNVYNGVNARICDKLGIENRSILVPKQNIKKLSTFCPNDEVETLKNALFETGAGAIGKYSECSFSTEGSGTYKPNDGANPSSGEVGIRSNAAETKIEVIFPSYLERSLIANLKKAHSYEEVAYDIVSLDNSNQQIGSGMIGDLPQPMALMDFLERVKKEMNANVIRYTAPVKKEVQRIAVCGGSGAGFLGAAIGQNADVFVTADFKYHQFFDADQSIVIADIGHFESEQFTSYLLHELLSQKFPTFALLLTKTITNPINYYT